MTTLPPTFAPKVRPSDCLVWIGATNNKGYGLIKIPGGKVELAHRVAYEAEYGPIPAGLVIDHTCRVRNCVRPEHLEAVTQTENNRRGRSAKSLTAADTCINGHLLTAADIYVRTDGKTECRLCRVATTHRSSRRRPTRQRRADIVRADLDVIATHIGESA